MSARSRDDNREVYTYSARERIASSVDVAAAAAAAESVHGLYIIMRDVWCI